MTTALIALIVVGIIALYLLLSINYIGPTEVGLVTKRFGLATSSDDNVIAFNGEAGYQAEAVDAGAPFKLWPDLRREEVPVGAGAGGRDRRGDRAGRRRAAYRREERACTSRSSATSRDVADVHRRRRTERCAAPGAAPGTLLPDAPGRLPGASRRARCTASRSRRTCLERERRRRRRLTAGVLRTARRRSCRSSGSRRAVRHDIRRYRDHAGRRPLPSGDIAEPARWLRRHQGAGARRGHSDSRDHRGTARQQERPAQQLPGLPASSSTTAARSACSTTRCCTARTC